MNRTLWSVIGCPARDRIASVVYVKKNIRRFSYFRFFSNNDFSELCFIGRLPNLFPGRLILVQNEIIVCLLSF